MCTLLGLWPVRIPSDLYYFLQDLRDRCVLSVIFFILVYGSIASCSVQIGVAGLCWGGANLRRW
jgi:hypothetical protein